ncbi:MAG: 16S rRNA (cytosine(967)-C(5))-methyltransferase RsmB [Actinomycetota bacterium]
MSLSARAVALEVIRRVTDEGAYSNRVLPAALARSGLDERDRALATELAYGTIRHVPGLDDAIGARAARPMARMTPGARAALRLGAYQILHTRIPAHAAVGETVGIVVPRERGFVNAILRRLAKEPSAPPAGRDDRAVSLRTGMTSWAIAELRMLLPPEEVESAAAGFGARAPLTLRVNRCRSTVEEVLAILRDTGIEARPGPVHPECLLVDGGDPTALPGWKEGRLAVQDQASAFVVDTLAPEVGDRVLDACAAPGGKTALIACRVGEEGRVVAGDRSSERTALIATLLMRLGLRADLLVHDATTPAVRGPFDRVLVDAPCTGIGSARRRPELLWRGRRDELSRLARLQVAIAAAGAALLRPGGRMVYSVCTFPRAETDAACDAILRHRPDLVPIETAGPAGSASAFRHRLWPHRHGTDGMFVAAFERSG